jgi:hypothetical protein
VHAQVCGRRVSSTSPRNHSPLGEHGCVVCVCAHTHSGNATHNGVLQAAARCRAAARTAPPTRQLLCSPSEHVSGLLTAHAGCAMRTHATARAARLHVRRAITFRRTSYGVGPDGGELLRRRHAASTHGAAPDHRLTGGQKRDRQRFLRPHRARTLTSLKGKLPVGAICCRSGVRAGLLRRRGASPAARV